VNVVQSMSIDPSVMNAQVWFIDPSNGDVCSIRIDGANRSVQLNARLNGFRDVLGIESMAKEQIGSPWRIVTGSLHAIENQVIMDQIKGRAWPFMSSDDGVNAWPTRIDGWLLGTEGIADFRTPDRRDWRVRPRGNSGLAVENSLTQDGFSVTFDTVFTSWWARNVTVLPGDLVIFELQQQICLLDMPNRQIKFLVRGRGPVVILPEE
jgi:hypothetical protein